MNNKFMFDVQGISYFGSKSHLKKIRAYLRENGRDGDIEAAMSEAKIIGAQMQADRLLKIEAERKNLEASEAYIKGVEAIRIINEKIKMKADQAKKARAHTRKVFRTLLKAAQDRGLNIRHISTEGKMKTSFYVKIPSGYYRISDHDLPKTNQRAIMAENGYGGRWDGKVITSDITATTTRGIILQAIMFARGKL